MFLEAHEKFQKVNLLLWGLGSDQWFESFKQFYNKSDDDLIDIFSGVDLLIPLDNLTETMAWAATSLKGYQLLEMLNPLASIKSRSKDYLKGLARIHETPAVSFLDRLGIQPGPLHERIAKAIYLTNQEKLPLLFRLPHTTEFEEQFSVVDYYQGFSENLTLETFTVQQTWDLLAEKMTIPDNRSLKSLVKFVERESQED